MATEALGTRRLLRGAVVSGGPRSLNHAARPSFSRNSAYLQWRIREAERGRVPVGPREMLKRQGEPVEVRVLPLRLEAQTVGAIGLTWWQCGLKTRSLSGGHWGTISVSASRRRAATGRGRGQL